jgi:enolase
MAENDWDGWKLVGDDLFVNNTKLLAKYNQLMRIEDFLKTTADYLGNKACYSIKN